MKENIHPKYEVVEVTCACGAKFKTRSTMKAVKLDICSACHPFFTGKQKMLDTEGRVEKFNKKFAATKGQTVARKPKTEVKAKAKRAVKKSVFLRHLSNSLQKRKPLPRKTPKKKRNSVLTTNNRPLNQEVCLL